MITERFILTVRYTKEEVLRGKERRMLDFYELPVNFEGHPDADDKGIHIVTMFKNEDDVLAEMQRMGSRALKSTGGHIVSLLSIDPIKGTLKNWDVNFDVSIKIVENNTEVKG